MPGVLFTMSVTTQLGQNNDSMKIITWNCHQAYRKKANLILEYCPDIVVVQECEELSRLQFTLETQMPNDSFWYGDDKNKGIGVFSYSDFQIESLSCHNPDFEYVIPLRIYNSNQEFIVLAIWTKPNAKGNYTKQIWNAIDYYFELISTEHIIILGDFNSSSSFDKPGRESNHTNIVEKLSQNRIHSAYHHHYSLSQGDEQHPTLYHQYNMDSPWHIDFCFLSESLLDKVSNVEIGQYEHWVKPRHSDHCPLIVSFD